MIFEPIACSAQMGHLYCVKISIISKETQMSFHLTHISEEFHRLPKMISEPIARSEQTMHLFCVMISPISKEIETSFHLTHIT
jgi:hypothetical protein